MSGSIEPCRTTKRLHPTCMELGYNQLIPYGRRGPIWVRHRSNLDWLAPTLGSNGHRYGSGRTDMDSKWILHGLVLPRIRSTENRYGSGWSATASDVVGLARYGVGRGPIWIGSVRYGFGIGPIWIGLVVMDSDASNYGSALSEWTL